MIAIAVGGEQPHIALLDLSSWVLQGRIELGEEPDWVVFGVDRNTLVMSYRKTQMLQIATRSTAGDWTLEPVRLGRPVVTMARSQNGSLVYVATTGLDQGEAPLQGNHYIQDQILAIDSRTGTIVHRVITTRRAEAARYPGDFLKWTAGCSPMGFDVLPNGDLHVVFAGSDELWRFGPKLNGPLDRVALYDLGIRTPHDVATMTGQRRIISSPADGLLAMIDAAGELVGRIELGLSGSELLQRDPEAALRREGEHLFYEATRSGRSCQSCHLHADSDYARHNIGDSDLMPAILSVRGVLGTSPFLRNGGYARVGHLLELANDTFGGFIYEDPNRERALEAYIYSLSASPNAKRLRDATPQMQEEERAGVAAFVKAQCHLCHSFPALTNASQHAATWLFPDFADPTRRLDTPSLVRTAAAPPYLYDGRAKTLREVLVEENLHNRHGDVAALNSAELDALIQFLERL